MRLSFLAQRGTAILIGVTVATLIGVGMTAPRGALAGNTEPSPGSTEPSPVAPSPLAAPVLRHPSDDTSPGSLVSLTFDDGPSPELTPRILDILKEKEVKAAFFLQGEYVKRYPELVQRIRAEGHVIGNHGWSHTNFEALSDREANAEIVKTNDAIERAIGERPDLFRYPFGAESDPGNKAIRDLGMWGGVMWHWDSHPGDYTCQGVENTKRYVVDNSVDQALILLHDGNDVVECGAEQLAYLPAAIDALRAKGFDFGVPVPADGPSEVNWQSWIKVVPTE